MDSEDVRTLLDAYEKLADEREKRSQQRHQETMTAIDEVSRTHNDLRQMAVNVTHIFSPDGDWVQMKKDVKRHNRIELMGKGIFALGAIFASAKSLLHLK